MAEQQEQEWNATVEYLRKNANESRDANGEEHITDVELANTLLAMKHWAAAEWLLRKINQSSE